MNNNANNNMPINTHNSLESELYLVKQSGLFLVRNLKQNLRRFAGEGLVLSHHSQLPVLLRSRVQSSESINLGDTNERDKSDEINENIIEDEIINKTEDEINQNTTLNKVEENTIKNKMEDVMTTDLSSESKNNQNINSRTLISEHGPTKKEDLVCFNKLDKYSNGLVIYDNETYALEPLSYRVQFLKDSQYFLLNPKSSKLSYEFFDRESNVESCKLDDKLMKLKS